MTDIQPGYGIDFGLLARPLRQYRPGALSTSELYAAAIQYEFTPAQTHPGHDGDVVQTATDLHRRLLDSGAFDDWAPADRQQRAAELVIAVIFDTQLTVVGDLQLTRHPDIDPELLKGFRRHWAAELVDFIQTSPAGLQVERVGMAAERGLDRLLPTVLLLGSLSATAHLTPDEFGHRLALGTTLVHRFVDERDDERAIAFAAGFGDDAHRLLLEAAQILSAESSCWPTLMELLHEHREQIVTDRTPADVLYAAANAAAGSRSDSAEALLEMSYLDSGTLPRDDDKTHVRIELHALLAAIHNALGKHDEALRCAHICAQLAAEIASQSEYGDADDWALPKAAGWILAAAERDPSARVLLLKRAYCKYDFRGALEGRLALLAANAYLELGRPEFAAYFLAQATGSARTRLVSDHFPCPVSWHTVGGLLETARVTDDELALSATELRRLGYLPEPETGTHFHWIDEQLCRNLYGDRSNLVAPKPKRL
ncbi:hypothetical protein NWT09_31055 [Mycolicibacterium sp. jd]|uniref:hypothetical protein n=1 Tax=unclassified Mycolicibacterium TaxID=2636767 RepID=UPI00351BD4E5